MVQQRPTQTFTFTPHTINTHSCKHTHPVLGKGPHKPPRPGPLAGCTRPPAINSYLLPFAICLPSGPLLKSRLATKEVSEGGAELETSACFSQSIPFPPEEILPCIQWMFWKWCQHLARGLISPSRPSLKPPGQDQNSRGACDAASMELILTEAWSPLRRSPGAPKQRGWQWAQWWGPSS